MNIKILQLTVRAKAATGLTAVIDVFPEKDFGCVLAQIALTL